MSSSGNPLFGDTLPGAGGTNVVRKIQSILIADSGVTAIVTPASIKAGFVGQSLPFPYIAHFHIAEREIRTHEGRGLLQHWAYQISCFADEYGQVFEMSNAVIEALGGYNSDGLTVFKIERGPYSYDDEVGAHHVPIDVECADNLRAAAPAVA